jgi:bis(5'-adenosyl)-triphosphatase
MKHKKDCPFCEPKVFGVTFLESKNFRAIYNAAPILPGHSMIVPKSHVESLMKLNDKELCELVRLGRDAVKVLQKAFHTRSFNWTIQEGEPAGQTVGHLHVHIIPRSAKDLPRPGDWYPKLAAWKGKIIDSKSRKRISKNEMDSIVSHLRKMK